MIEVEFDNDSINSDRVSSVYEPVASVARVASHPVATAAAKQLRCVQDAHGDVAKLARCVQ